MAIIKITLPAGEPIYDGKLTSFEAPCDCNEVTAIAVRMYGDSEYIQYSLVDAAGIPVSGIVGAFASGAVVRVLLKGSQAIIQNASYASYSRFGGEYNINKEDTVFEIGNGTSDSSRSNALEVYKDGHVEVQTQGETDNSVITNKTLKNEINKVLSTILTNNDYGDELPTDMTNYPAGRIFFKKVSD